jgi:predicted HTH transcriptional regulator
VSKKTWAFHNKLPKSEFIKKRLLIKYCCSPFWQRARKVLSQRETQMRCFRNHHNRLYNREAVINAFCHRDYYEYDSVNIAIFKDRLEIRNPGGLFGGLTIEQIKSEMVSRRRNEIIAELFHRIHFVEKWGRGISTTAVDKNIDTLKKQGILKRVGPDKGGHWEIKI